MYTRDSFKYIHVVHEPPIVQYKYNLIELYQYVSPKFRYYNLKNNKNKLPTILQDTARIELQYIGGVKKFRFLYSVQYSIIIQYIYYTPVLFIKSATTGKCAQ